MSEIVTVRRDGAVAVVVLDNPPVNALGFALRAPLARALEALRDDATAQAIVIACAGRTFVAGADITEFGKPIAKPELRDIIAILESIGKPTVAAIHGTALGGGLELALGCHFRVTDASARLGLPEVKLGLLPGAGGTIRLPRLVGPIKALGMIVGGTMVTAAEAKNAGLVDEIVEGDLVPVAVDFAKAVLATGSLSRRVRDRDDRLTGVDLAAFDAEASRLTTKARGLEAPLACARSIRNALTLPFDEALAEERALFGKLVTGEQSRAQRHLFFAEREAAKGPGIDKDVSARRIDRVGVVGAGTMGAGIAMAFANAGLSVTLLDMNASALDRGMATIDKTYATSVSRGSLTGAEKERRLSRISGTTNFPDLAACDLVIEAVFEDMAVKRQVFERLDAVARPGAILATNTSYLDVNVIAAATRRPEDVIGLHFFSPANVMRLLEIVRADRTAPDVIATALSLARRIGKAPVVVGVCHGFVGNRMLSARGAELESLLIEGASPQEVDDAFVAFGWPMGPFAMSDLAGLDIGWSNRKARGVAAPIADALCETGRFGQKTGRGYYRYDEGSRTPQPDPEVAALIVATAQGAGVEPRQVSAEEIIERTLYPMINEGMRILDEGIATRASDIDLVWVHGYGFPVGKGGPMHFAEVEGLAKIVARLNYWHERTGRALYEPSHSLAQRAASSKTA